MVKIHGILPTTEVCGTLTLSNRIYGGDETDIDEYPWIALILPRNENFFLKCSGSLINKYFVVTTAHCITSINSLSDVLVRLGEWNLDKDHGCNENRCELPLQEKEIDAIIKHPEYKTKSMDNDVALLPFMSGWGGTENKLYSPIKLKATDHILSVVQKKRKGKKDRYYCNNVLISNSKIYATALYKNEHNSLKTKAIDFKPVSN
ncbi:CLIP domain-containing serine protease 2-like [Bactrocera tryoni]|uniref:CLIP domain-containing serine protease 2-like n=1 Tax=Bactrocera tryoni TaxID=59916 RepID=UPI001A995764|nr:CLIP domain-containing serine protease 2-like [Bactrocera tryoni]